MAFKDIRKSQPFLTPADIAFMLFVLVMLVGLLALNFYVARTFPGGEWLFQRWAGVRAYWSGSSEPYGALVAQQTQALVYGRDAFLNEYPYALNDPLYIILLYSPLKFFSDFVTVRALWMLFAEAALAGVIFLSLRLTEWQAPGWVVAAIFLLGFFNYFSLQALLSASPAIFLVLLVLGILLALRSQADETAGLLLALLAYQWEVTAMAFLALLVLALVNRRWNVATVLTMVTVALGAAAFLATPRWFLLYAQAIVFNWNRQLDIVFGTALAFTFPAFQTSYAIWVTVGLSLLMLAEVIRAMDGQFVHIYWVVFLGAAITPLMGLAAFPSNHVVLVPAIVLVLALAWERWRSRRLLVFALLSSLWLGVSFGLYYFTQSSTARLATDLQRFAPPLLTILGLYWMRWWAIRPPRIWADQIGVRK